MFFSLSYTNVVSEGSVGFSVLPKDNSTCDLGKPGAESLTIWLADDYSSPWATAAPSTCTVLKTTSHSAGDPIKGQAFLALYCFLGSHFQLTRCNLDYCQGLNRTEPELSWKSMRPWLELNLCVNAYASKLTTACFLVSLFWCTWTHTHICRRSMSLSFIKVSTPDHTDRDPVEALSRADWLVRLLKPELYSWQLRQRWPLRRKQQ